MHGIVKIQDGILRTLLAQKWDLFIFSVPFIAFKIFLLDLQIPIKFK